jgi:ParB/RepB/Spo0J family partition protein
MAKPGTSINDSITDLVRSRERTAAAAPPSSSTQYLLLDEIVPSPFQPPGRRAPSDEAVMRLADDLVARKQLMNIVVRPLAPGRYELMAGERRWRAFILNRTRAAPDRRAEWQMIRAEVRTATDAEAADIVAAENLQREELTPLDEAFTYAQLMVLRNFQQAKQLADHLNIPVRTIQRLLQLHRAPDFLKEAMTRGVLVEEHEGEDVARVHRKLDKELALLFLRYYNDLAKQPVPGLVGDIALAATEETSAAAALAAATDLSSREAAQRRLAKAETAKARAQTRHDNESSRRATARTKTAIERTLRENWSLRKATSVYVAKDDATPEGGVPKPHASGPAKARAPRTANDALFVETGAQLVINRDLVPKATREQRASLEVLLETLIEALAADSAPTGDFPTSAPARSDPANGGSPDPEGDRAPGGIAGSATGSAGPTPPTAAERT